MPHDLCVPAAVKRARVGGVLTGVDLGVGPGTGEMMGQGTGTKEYCSLGGGVGGGVSHGISFVSHCDTRQRVGRGRDKLRWVDSKAGRLRRPHVMEGMWSVGAV